MRRYCIQKPTKTDKEIALFGQKQGLILNYSYYGSAVCKTGFADKRKNQISFCFTTTTCICTMKPLKQIFKFIAYQERLEGTGPMKPGNRGEQRCQIRQDTKSGDLKDEERLYKKRTPSFRGRRFLLAKALNGKDLL